MKRYLRLLLHKIYMPVLRRKLRKNVTEKIDNFIFKIPPTVFNPVDFYSSRIFAGYISKIDLNGKTILDMGCGSGIISIFAASKGAECVAIDINPSSVEATQINAKQNNLENEINILQGNLYNTINELQKFDFIFFNPPYYKGTPEDDFEMAFKGGENLEVIRSFISDSKRFLASHGKILLIVSSDMNVEELESWFFEGGFEFNVEETHKKFFETFYIISAVVTDNK